MYMCVRGGGGHGSMIRAEGARAHTHLQRVWLPLSPHERGEQLVFFSTYSNNKKDRQVRG